MSALRACLRLTAQRESKEDSNSLNYHVSVWVGLVVVRGCGWNDNIADSSRSVM